MSKPGLSGLARLGAAWRNSVQGLRAAWQYEAAFRQELALCAVLVPIGLWLGDSTLQRLALVGSLILVLIVEILNSAIEAVVDLASPEHHALAGRAKDMGSAAVWLSLLLAALCWGTILLCE